MNDVTSVDETSRFRPLRDVRQLKLLIASLVCWSCVVPVDIPRPDPGDAGSDAGASLDAGSPLDAGSANDAGIDAGVVMPGPCSVPENLGIFFAGNMRQFRFPGCAASGFSSEPGVTVSSSPNADGSATVEITPSRLGAWVLTIDANGATQTRELLTDEQFKLDGGVVRRYPDRVDDAPSGPDGRARTVTRGGRLVLASTLDRLLVYGTDAGLEQSIAADAWPLVWSGGSLWTRRPRSTIVERWVESPTGLVSSGTVDGVERDKCFLFCRVTEDTVTSVNGTDLVEFSWDAGSFSSQVLTSGLWLQFGSTALLIPEPPDKVWSADGCSYEPGCTTTVCAAIQTCPLAGLNRIVMATDQHALIYDGFNGVIQLWELPLSRRKALHARPGSWRSTSPSNDAVTLVGSGNFLAEPVIHRNRIVYRHFAVEDTATITKHWVVLPEPPRSLRFIPR